MNTDIVVIGTGFAGLAAAIEAHDAGASVAVIEKMHAPGGNSIISDGGIAAAGTAEQSRKGIEDSADLFYRDMMKAGLGINCPELVKTVAENSSSALEWLRDCINVVFMEKIEIFGGHSVPRCFTAENVTGASIIKKQIEKVREKNITVMYHTLFTGFLTDSRGRINGVRVRENYKFKTGSAGEEKIITAGKGVILATGGFGGDTGFRAVQDPRLGKDTDTTNQPFATAEGLKEGLRIGACPVQLSHIQLGPWASPDEKGYGSGPAFSEYVVFQRGLIADSVSGKRIVNELGDRKTVADAILAAGKPCLGIADSAAVEESGWDIETCLKKGVVKQFDSIDRLSDFYGTDPSGLEETIARFNVFVKNRKDTDFNKLIIESASEIKTPPFYSIRLWPKVHYTMGGLRINSSAQVIDLDGKVIENLYAAGEVTGGVHGACRLGSCAITDCIVFGRIAGKNCALKSI